MKLFVMMSMVCLVTALSGQQASVPELPYRSVPDFLKLPADVYLGEAAGVAVNSKGHVFVFSRGNTGGRLTQPEPRSFSSLLQMENLSGKSATISMHGRSRIR